MVIHSVLNTIVDQNNQKHNRQILEEVLHNLPAVLPYVALGLIKALATLDVQLDCLCVLVEIRSKHH